MSVKYKRVLIKVSGEALAGEDRFGVNGAVDFLMNCFSPIG